MTCYLHPTTVSTATAAVSTEIPTTDDIVPPRTIDSTPSTTSATPLRFQGARVYSTLLKHLPGPLFVRYPDGSAHNNNEAFPLPAVHPLYQSLI